MTSFHVAVWIDHDEARVFYIGEQDYKETTLRAPNHHVHRHPKGVGWDKAHPADAEKYFHEVATALNGAGEILVVGPGNAKLGLLRHVHKHDSALEKKIVGVETADHPTDGQLVAHARKYFRAEDRMRGLVP